MPPLQLKVDIDANRETAYVYNSSGSLGLAAQRHRLPIARYKDHILYQVCYGFKKAYGGHGNLIKVITMRSSQLLNEECIAVLTQLQLGQIRMVVDFLEACISPHGDAKDFVVAAV